MLNSPPNIATIIAVPSPPGTNENKTSAIVNPLHSEVVQSVRAADVVMGNDPACGNWISVYREPVAEAGGEREGRRRSRRRRARA